MNKSGHRHSVEVSSITFAVVTVSDSRTEETDRNGRFLRQAVEQAGWQTVFYRIIPDERASVREALDHARREGADIVIFNGGTGLAARDTTPDVLEPLYQKKLEGFGEIFRMLSYHEVGSAAMLSRASAGLVDDVFVFSVPGSPQAVQLAWEKLIRDEAAHLIGLRVSWGKGESG